MKINDQLRFVHPVLSPVTGDFSDFVLDLEVQISEVPLTGELSLSCSIMTQHQDFNNALNKGDIICFGNLICRNTYYNEFHSLNPKTTNINIQPGLLRGRTTFRTICTARNQLDVSGWENIHNEFDKRSCVNSKSSLIGMSDEFVFEVGRDKLQPFESIFRLIKDDALNEDTIAVDVDKQYIRIAAPTNLYLSINALRNTPLTRDILLNSIYFAATMEVLSFIQSEPNGFEDKWWFRVFSARCNHLGIDIENQDILKSTQILLNQSLGKLHKLQSMME